MNKRGRPPKDIPFKQVLELVKEGYGEKEAILKSGYKNTTHFYHKLTGEQKAELRMAKVEHRKHGKYFGNDVDDYFRQES